MQELVRPPFFPLVKKAVAEYRMIEPGDKIAIGVSGGKDSTTLLYTLAVYQRMSPIDFSLQAIILDLGWEMDLTPLAELCAKIKVPLHVEKTEIGPIIFAHRQESNPCSLCARMRRGALHNLAKQFGCNKVALGHHLDDAIETLLLCMTFEGRIKCFLPRTYLSRKQLTLIRPLVYVQEQEIRRTVKDLGLPVLHNPCPANGLTKRQEIKELVKAWEKINPDLRFKLCSALKHVEVHNLWLPENFMP